MLIKRDKIIINYIEKEQKAFSQTSSNENEKKNPKHLIHKALSVQNISSAVPYDFRIYH